MKTSKVEINLAFPIELPHWFVEVLSDATSRLAKENVPEGMVHWYSGGGAKYNPLTDLADDSIYEFRTTCRHDYHNKGSVK